MLRSLLAILTIIVLTVVYGIPAALLTLIHPGGDWVLRFGRHWARGICAASGVTVEGRGAENLPRDRPVLLLANHKSNFDMLAIVLTMPISFRVVAKRFLFYIPIFGWCLWASGMIPIDRKRRSRAIVSLQEAAARVRGGTPVLFFPEGTRSLDGRLLPFKKGAFVIAFESGAPIVPVSISGGLAVLPKGSLRIRPGHMTVQYGAPIPLEGHTLDKKERLMDQVRDAIQAGLDAIRAQPGQEPPPALGVRAASGSR